MLRPSRDERSSEHVLLSGIGRPHVRNVTAGSVTTAAVCASSPSIGVPDSARHAVRHLDEGAKRDPVCRLEPGRFRRRPPRAGGILGSGQMVLPSLFEFATSELSQDAFLCWVAAHAGQDERAEARRRKALLVADRGAGCSANPATYFPGGCAPGLPEHVRCSVTATIPAGCTLWNATSAGFALCFPREVGR
jgi:hypothetical protein